MVQIEDGARLDELMLMFKYEQRGDPGASYCKIIGAQDAALLRRSGAIVREARPGSSPAHFTTFHYKGCQFREVYMIADKVMREQAPTGLPC